jgi:hypothetical protein
MNLTFWKILTLLVLVGVPVTAGTVLYSGLASPDNWNTHHYKDGGVRGAPGPIVGAGLPVLVVGYGAYWLIKRRRRKPD